jgi:hypothetical protein
MTSVCGEDGAVGISHTDLSESTSLVTPLTCGLEQLALITAAEVTGEVANKAPFNKIEVSTVGTPGFKKRALV